MCGPEPAALNNHGQGSARQENETPPPFFRLVLERVHRSGFLDVYSLGWVDINGEAEHPILTD